MRKEGEKKRKPSSDNDGSKREKKEHKRKKKPSESGESIQVKFQTKLFRYMICYFRNQ